MNAPAALYTGRVMHARLDGVRHRFEYKVLYALVSLRQLGDAGRMARLFSVDRPNLLSIHQKKHGPPRDTKKTSLLESVEALADANGVDASGEITLLAFPRVLGHVFNPLSVFFLSGADGTPSGIIYEVRNTFGGIHHYTCPVQSESGERGSITQTAEKIFYVSPFQNMEQTYNFKVRWPGDKASVRIFQHSRGKPTMAASLFGERLELTDRNILSALRKTRMSSLKVLGGIHYEAAHIFRKGARYHPEPKQSQ